MNQVYAGVGVDGDTLEPPNRLVRQTKAGKATCNGRSKMLDPGQNRNASTKIIMLVLPAAALERWRQEHGEATR